MQKTLTSNYFYLLLCVLSIVHRLFWIFKCIETVLPGLVYPVAIYIL